MSRGRRYDQAITIFSPEGRIYQVEYALELVKRGAPIVGINSSEGAVLAGIEIETNPLALEENSKKIFKLDDHTGTAIAGLSPDARVLIKRARLICQSHRLTYDEPVDIETLTGDIGDLYQTYTQNAGVRPFGVSMIIGGIDFTGVRIVSIDPSGSYRIYNANAVGRNNEKAKDRLKELYRKDLTLDEAKSVAIDALKSVSSQELTSSNVKMAVIPLKTKKYKELTTEELIRFF